VTSEPDQADGNNTYAAICGTINGVGQLSFTITLKGRKPVINICWNAVLQD
jgi:hypothetical protein